MDTLEEKQISSDNREKNVWSESSYGGENYDRVTEFQLKKDLDREIFSKVKEYTPSGGVFIEFGCGRAPVSEIITQENIEIDCIGLEKNISMLDVSKVKDLKIQIIEEDMANLMGVDSSLRQKADTISLENSWYAVTTPGEKNRNYSDEEAFLLRRTALANVAYCLKDGGILIVSDPLESAKNLGAKDMADFATREIKARVRNGYTEVQAFRSLIDELGDPRNKEVRKYNQKITQQSKLFPDINTIQNFISNTGWFEIVEYKDNDYIGHNASIVARRTSRPVDKIISNDELSKIPEITNKVVVPTDHPELGKNIGEYRRYGYTEGKINPGVPVHDEWDRIPESRTVVLLGDSPNPLAVVSLNIYDKKKDNLEMKEIMEINEGSDKNFLDAIKERIKFKEGLEIENVAELRRFSSSIVGKKEISPRELGNFMVNVMKQFSTELTKITKEENISTVLFITDPNRMKIFNYGLRDTETQFQELPGFRLKRDSVENQTLLISGADYFLGRWSNGLTEEEIESMDQLRSEIFEKDGSDWKATIERSDRITNKELCKKTTEKVLSTVPDNVKLYYALRNNASNKF